MAWIAIYVTGYIVAVILCGGWFYSEMWAKFPRIHNDREDLGFAIVLGLFYALIWPAGIILAFLLTGFAEHGCWTKPRKLSQSQ